MFDLDETLFDRSSSLRIFIQQQFLRIAIGRFRNFNELADRFLQLDNRGRVSKRDVYRTIVDEIGSSNEHLAGDLFDDYEVNAWRYARPFEDTRDTLLWLRNAGIKTAIVSNGQTHIQLRTLLALNLDRLVDTYLISEQEGCRKPDAAIFLKAAERLSVKVEDCLFVGDSPEADILGARSVGMRTVWFPNGAEWPHAYSFEPSATISRLQELRPIIEHWHRA